jgi:hypothetical protein
LITGWAQIRQIWPLYAPSRRSWPWPVASHYQHSTCAVSMADCVAAVTALRLDLPLATSDPALATVVRAEAGSVVGLVDSRGRRP